MDGFAAGLAAGLALGVLLWQAVLPAWCWRHHHGR